MWGVFLAFPVFGETGRFDLSLKAPSVSDGDESLDLLLSKARKSAMQRDIFRFYEEANQLLPMINNDL